MSREEAIDILSKWAAESSSLWFMFVSGAAFINFGGRIEFMAGGTFRAVNGGYVDAIVDCSQFTEFRYSDAREFPADMRQDVRDGVACQLSMESASTKLLICELWA